VASRRILQCSLETPSSFETVLTHLLRMRAMGQKPTMSQTLGMRSETEEPDIQDGTNSGLSARYSLRNASIRGR